MRRPVVYLVCSSGGHLVQLHMLSARFAVGDEAPELQWATYGSKQADTLLGAGGYTRVHGPTTRSGKNAIKNLALARKELARVRPDFLISTGAGVALPFLQLGSRLGIPSIYIESATRRAGPSLTGKLLQRLGGVALTNQHPDSHWPSWSYAASAYEGFQVVGDGGSIQAQPPLRRVFVTLGGHGDFPFPRLVQRVRRVLPRDVEVVWQLGSTPRPENLPGVAHVSMGAEDYARHLEWADVIVGHAGTGVALSCLAAGKTAVLVPRTAAEREHVDDHQVETAATLASRGYAICSRLEELELSHLQRAQRMVVLDASDLLRPIDLLALTGADRAGRRVPAAA